MSLQTEITPLLRRYAETFPGWRLGELPSSWLEMRALAEYRRDQGIRLFGYDPDSYVGRDNLAEATEEAADGLNYLAFDLAEHGPHDIELHLLGAQGFHKGFEAARMLRTRRRLRAGA